MSATVRRVATIIPFGLVLALFTTGAAPRRADLLNANQVVILSTTDVKGKTSPCGCHIPKGGLSRQIGYVDSLKSTYGQVVWVDNGGFFPEHTYEVDAGKFLIESMKMLGIDAVGLGERDLMNGAGYLKREVRRTGLPMVCANLVDKQTKQLLFAPSATTTAGAVRVGIFGLINEKAELGPSHDSLAVLEPTAVAKQVVADLRSKGAEVIVLLSQLGKVESEDLVTAVEGIDVLVVGLDAPLLEQGRMLKNTLACYGGDQGQYMCQSIITIDAKRHMTTGTAGAVALDPGVQEKPAVLQMVKAFEASFNEKMRKQEMTRAAEATTKNTQNSADHYVGASLCVRCHTPQGEQWKTTAHSIAWQTLIDAKKDATPECIPCHSVGYKEAGGFVNAAMTPQFTDVQCENCHGIGTQHDAMSGKAHPITDATCIKCHHGEHDPEFDFAKKLPMIAHGNMSGESMRSLQSKLKSGSGMMRGH